MSEKMNDKIVYVFDQITPTPTGYYAVSYEAYNQQVGNYFHTCLFDSRKSAREFIAECKRTIKENKH